MIEEPYEGNPHVRFREGERIINNGIHLFRHESEMRERDYGET